MPRPDADRHSRPPQLFAFDIPLAALYSLSLLTTLDSRGPISAARSVAHPSINVGLPSTGAGPTYINTPIVPSPEWYAKQPPSSPAAYPPASPAPEPRSAPASGPGTPRSLALSAHRRTAGLARGGLDVVNKTLEMLKSGAGTGDITPPRPPRSPGITVTREVATEFDRVEEQRGGGGGGAGGRRVRVVRVLESSPGTPDSW